MPVFPNLGVEGYVIQKEIQEVALPTKNPFSNSIYIHDEIINPHPRFGTLTKNICQRRGSTIDIRVPIDDKSEIHMDTMAFGMGSCCLQCTFSTQTYD